MHGDIDRVLSLLVKVKNTADDHEQRIVQVERVVA